MFQMWRIFIELCIFYTSFLQKVFSNAKATKLITKHKAEPNWKFLWLPITKKREPYFSLENVLQRARLTGIKSFFQSHNRSCPILQFQLIPTENFPAPALSCERASLASASDHRNHDRPRSPNKQQRDSELALRVRATPGRSRARCSWLELS